jgi:hypothetical protein
MTIREKALENIVLNECFKIRSMYIEKCKEKLDELRFLFNCCKRTAKSSELKGG